MDDCQVPLGQCRKDINMCFDPDNDVMKWDCNECWNPDAEKWYLTPHNKCNEKQKCFDLLGQEYWEYFCDPDVVYCVDDNKNEHWDCEICESKRGYEHRWAAPQCPVYPDEYNTCIDGNGFEYLHPFECVNYPPPEAVCSASDGKQYWGKEYCTICFDGENAFQPVSWECDMQDCEDTYGKRYEATDCVDTYSRTVNYCKVQGVPRTDCQFCRPDLSVGPDEWCPLMDCWDQFEEHYMEVQCDDSIVICYDENNEQHRDCLACDDFRGGKYPAQECIVSDCSDVNGDSYEFAGDECPTEAPLVCYSDWDDKSTQYWNGECETCFDGYEMVTKFTKDCADTYTCFDSANNEYEATKCRD